MRMMDVISDDILTKLAANATAADSDSVWPTSSWQAITQAGVLGWCIPTEHGGTDLSRLEQLEGHARLSSACMTTCFILSQRDAACRRIREHGSDMLRRE